MAFKGSRQEHAIEALDDYRRSIIDSKEAIRAAKRKSCGLALDHLESAIHSAAAGRAEQRHASGHPAVMDANKSARRWKALARKAFRKRCMP